MQSRIAGVGSSHPMDVTVHEAAEAPKPAGTASRAGPAVTKRADGHSHRKSASHAAAAVVTSDGATQTATPSLTKPVPQPATPAAAQGRTSNAVRGAAHTVASPAAPSDKAARPKELADSDGDTSADPAPAADQQMNGHHDVADEELDPALQGEHAQKGLAGEAEPAEDDQANLQRNDGSDSQVSNDHDQ